MLTDAEIIAIRQFCMDRAITILGASKESVTLDRQLEVAKAIEDFLLQVVDTTKVQLGRD